MTIYVSARVRFNTYYYYYYSYNNRLIFGKTRELHAECINSIYIRDVYLAFARVRSPTKL